MVNVTVIQKCYKRQQSHYNSLKIKELFLKLDKLLWSFTVGGCIWKIFLFNPFKLKPFSLSLRDPFGY